MKNIIIVSAILISVVAMVYSCDNKKTSDGSLTVEFDTATYQPIPQGYGYMADTAKLSLAVASCDIPYVRQHAWSLWAGIMQQGDSIDWPVWYTWPTTQLACKMPNPDGKMLGVSENNNSKSLIQINKANTVGGTIMDTLHLPVYNIPDSVAKKYPSAVHNNNINPGKHFLFNQDIMIPTESISLDGYNWVRQNRLYNPDVLNSLNSSYRAGKGQHVLGTPPTQIITKHMFWPVPATGISAIPVWNDDYDSSYTSYAGYETWKSLIALDPGNQAKSPIVKVSYLHGVLKPDGKTPYDSITKMAVVHKLSEFYSHKITQADWDSFDDNDKAILNASSYWAYNKPIGVGDYLVTIAMHINTKEVPTWALQSVFWSDTPDLGKFAANRPALPDAKGPWAHYKLVDGYGITSPNSTSLPVGMNPYIELVIHPVATNCNNCHIRAGWPEGKIGDSASYQNPACLSLLQKFSTSSTPCLQKILLTDFQWYLSDDAKGNISVSKSSGK